MRNVAAAHVEVVAERRRWLDARENVPSPEGSALHDDAKEKLAALGYVAGTRKEPDLSKDPAELIDAVNFLFRGMTLVSEGNPRGALPYLQNAYREDPNNAFAVFHLANCFREVGELGTAMTYYRRAIDLDPSIAEAWAHLAVLRWERGDRDIATRLLSDGLAANPASFALHISAGELAFEVGHLEEAEVHFHAAADAEPRLAAPWTQLAAIAERRGNATEARRLRDRAASLAGEGSGS
jgi:Flp pilus assembly protein TadD